jgi:hypothetical protein
MREQGRSPGGRVEATIVGLVAVLVGGGWVWYAWAQTGGALDTATLVTGGLFVFTLLVAWRSFELFLATVRRHFELRHGLDRFDERIERFDARLKHPTRQ